MLSMIDIDEFTRAAGIDLTSERISDLREMLHLQETGKWRWPEWTVTDPEHAADLVAARALIGLLILGEDTLWTAPTRHALRGAFQRLVHSVSQLGTQAEAPGLFDLGDGVTVKIRHANGEERLERLDTGKRVQFICSRYPEATRGYVADLLVCGRHRFDLLPTVAPRPNPQIVYV